MVKPKYIILMHCGIEISFKKILNYGKDLFNLGGIIRNLDLEELTVSLLKLNQIDRL